MCEQRTTATSADDLIDALKGSLQNGLDTLVVAIAHFTDETSGAGFAPEPCSVAHALHSARDHETATDQRRGLLHRICGLSRPRGTRIGHCRIDDRMHCSQAVRDVDVGVEGLLQNEPLEQ